MRTRTEDELRVAERIGIMRRRKKINGKRLTAKALSIQCGWAPSRVSRIETGKIPLFVGDLILLARQLGMRAGDFLEE